MLTSSMTLVLLKIIETLKMDLRASSAASAFSLLSSPWQRDSHQSQTPISDAEKGA